MVPSTKSFPGKIARRYFGPLALVALLAVLATAAQARQRSPQLRTVHGTVLSPSDAPIPSAVVYLKNLRTLTIRTYISDQKGHYRFSGLDPNVDYQIHAEHQDFTSNTRTISSYDSRHDIIIDLKVNRKKSDK